jgi:arsenite methyltransferase
VNGEVRMESPNSERAAQLRSAVRDRYAVVSREPQGHFAYPIGTESLTRLGYRAEWLAAVPSEIANRFVGVGNPLSLRPARRGERVLDVGCGCGLDTFAAASMVGNEGQAVGLDLTPEMLEIPRTALARTTLKNLQFQQGGAEALPFEDASFDLVISNGVLNLVPDKDAAFHEIARVLRPQGEFVAADLIVVETVPDQVLASMDAWSS